MKKLFTVAIAILSTYVTFAYSVRVRVDDGTGDGEAFATCRIFSSTDSLKPIIAGIADSLGFYRADLANSGNYRLVATTATGTGMVAKSFAIDEAHPDVNLGTIIVKTKAEMLGEVTVTAQRPLVIKKIDRIGYDVQADPDVRTINLQDMMRRVPLIAVDAEGNITINGSSNFKIFKDGRPNNAFTKNAKDIFKAIPASMIKSIEVITEPGAKYDAEGIGAILNIVTLDSSRVDGVTGTVSLNGDSHSQSISPNGYITTQIDKVTLSLNGGYQQQNSKASRSVTTGDYTYANGNTSHSVADSENKFKITWFGLEASYDINKKNLITAEANGYWYNIKTKSDIEYSMSDATGNVLNAYRSISPFSPMSYFTIDGAINYQYTPGHPGETITAGYLLSNTNQTQKQETAFSNITGSMLGYDRSTSDTHMKFQEHTFQADWVRPFNNSKHTLETGAKYTLRINDSRVDNYYEGIGSQLTDFSHITDIGAIYGQYTGRFGHFTFRGGLRYEFSKLKAEFNDKSQKDFSTSLNDLVPSASASWQVTDANSLTFNYAMRINRPGINYLNPAVYQGASEISYGNPDLESAHSNSLKLTYTHMRRKVTLNASASYGFNNDDISSVRFVDPQGYVVTTYDNIGSERELRFSTYVQWTASNKTRVMFNGAIGRTSYEQSGMHLARWGHMASLRVTQQLPLDISLEGFISSYSMGANNVYSYSTVPAITFYGIGLTRSFLKDKRLSLRLSAYNFASSKYQDRTQHVVNGDYTGLSTTSYRNFRGVQIGISYRFGNLNARVKQTARKAEKEAVEGGIGK